MKSKSYKTGKSISRSYLKPVGNGYEVGLVLGRKPIFVGNFIRMNEANKWFLIMKKEISLFSKRYKVGPAFPKSWYVHFLSSHLYKCYYAFVDKVCVKHEQLYKRAVNKDMRKYRKLNKHWQGQEKIRFLRAA